MNISDEELLEPNDLISIQKNQLLKELYRVDPIHKEINQLQEEISELEIQLDLLEKEMHKKETLKEVGYMKKNVLEIRIKIEEINKKKNEKYDIILNGE